MRRISVVTSDRPFEEKCFNFAEGDEVAIAAFLAEDPNHVFVGNRVEKQCWPRDQLVDLLSSKEFVLQNCTPKGAGQDVNRDLDRSKTYVKVGSYFYVETSNFKDCLRSGANQWEAEDTGVVFSRMGSVDAMDNLNYVSGSHCQPGKFELYRLIPRIQVAPKAVASVAEIVLETVPITSPPITLPSDLTGSVRNLLEEIVAAAPKTRKTRRSRTGPTRMSPPRARRPTRISPTNILQPRECADAPFQRFDKNFPLMRHEAQAFRLNDTINPKNGEPIRKCSRAWQTFDQAARTKFNL